MEGGILTSLQRGVHLDCLVKTKWRGGVDMEVECVKRHRYQFKTV
jgi:hypothetical protein